MKLNDGKLNEIKLEIKIEEKDINNKIYFLDNTQKDLKYGGYYEGFRYASHIAHDHLKELNVSNTEIFINNEKYKFKKYFEPKEKGIYNINIKLNIKMIDCSFMFCGCYNLTDINLSSLDTKYIRDMRFMFN